MERKNEGFEEIIPKEYWSFKEKVFNKKVFEKLPE